MTALHPHRGDDPAPPPTPRTAPTSPPHRVPGHRFYLSVSVKFVVSVLFAPRWTGASVWISLPWVTDLSHLTGDPAAWIIVSLVTFLPGIVVALMSLSLLLDHQPPFRVNDAITR